MKKIPMLEKFAAQSLVYVDTGLDDGKELIFSKEKFAELIVKECVSVGRTAFLSDNSTVPIFPAKQIKEHFGVEE